MEGKNFYEQTAQDISKLRRGVLPLSLAVLSSSTQIPEDPVKGAHHAQRHGIARIFDHLHSDCANL